MENTGELQIGDVWIRHDSEGDLWVRSAIREVASPQTDLREMDILHYES